MNFPENTHELPSFSITALPLQTQLGGRSDGSLKTVSPFTRCCTAMGIPILVPQGAVDVSELPRGTHGNPSMVSRVSRGTHRVSPRFFSGLRANPKGDVPEGARGLKGSLDRFATQLHHSHLRATGPPESCTKGEKRPQVGKLSSCNLGKS